MIPTFPAVVMAAVAAMLATPALTQTKLLTGVAAFGDWRSDAPGVLEVDRAPRAHARSAGLCEFERLAALTRIEIGPVDLGPLRRGIARDGLGGQIADEARSSRVVHELAALRRPAASSARRSPFLSA